MITDLGKHGVTPAPSYDLVVIGTGPAGTTVVNELAGKGLSICVLESGRLKPNRHGDELRRVESEGIHIKDYSRERVLGGASTTWAGLSSPLDPEDMLPRPWLEHSGWPLEREELLPYWAGAAERYRFPPLSYFETDSEEGLGPVRAGGDVQGTWSAVEEKVFLACAEPQNFGREFRELFESDAVDVFLDATVLRLEAEPDTRRIARCVVRTSAGAEHIEVHAQHFVIA